MYSYSSEILLRDSILLEDDVEYMNHFSDKFHKINEIILYMGQTSIKGEVVVKVFNFFDVNCTDIFTIYIKEKIIKGKVKIPDEKLFQILLFINKNYDSIIKYSDIQNTFDALQFKNSLIF